MIGNPSNHALAEAKSKGEKPITKINVFHQITLSNIKIKCSYNTKKDMKLKDIVTQEFGLIIGRDAIEVKKIEIINPRKIEAVLSISRDLCSIKPNVVSDFFLVKFLFDGVIMFNLRLDEIRGVLSDKELDMYAKSESESAFVEIENSKKVKKNNGLNGFNHLKHLLINAYDYDIEVVCSSFDIQMVNHV